METAIPIDTSIEDYIKELEEKVKNTKKESKKTMVQKGSEYCRNISLEGAPKFMKDIANGINLLDMKRSF